MQSSYVEAIMTRLLDLLDRPGEHHEFVQGLAGSLQVIITVPEKADRRYLAVLGHPHSLQGGTMNNKVVTTMAKTFYALDIISIRFNFRGVGLSEGSYDDGVGESDDMLHLLNQCISPNVMIFFAGFSFGSFVAFRALTAFQKTSVLRTALISIAPPIHHYDYTAALASSTPWLVVQGMDDDVVPQHLVSAYFEHRKPAPQIVYFEETGHFFHGKLIELKLCLTDTIRQWMA